MQNAILRFIRLVNSVHSLLMLHREWRMEGTSAEIFYPYMTFDLNSGAEHCLLQTDKIKISKAVEGWRCYFMECEVGGTRKLRNNKAAL